MHRMMMGDAEIVDLGGDDEYDGYDQGDGLGFSIGGLLKGVAKVATAPAKLAFKGAKTVATKVVAPAAKFVVTHPLDVASVVAGGAAGLGVKKLAGKLFGGGKQPAIAPSQTATGGTALVPSQREAARQAKAQAEAQRKADEAERKRANAEKKAADKAAKAEAKRAAAERRKLAAETARQKQQVLQDQSTSRQQKQDLLAQLDQQARDAAAQLAQQAAVAATGAATAPTMQVPSGAGAVVGGGDVPVMQAEATPEAGGGFSLAGMMQGPMPLLLFGVAALFLFGGRQAAGGRRRR